MKKILLVSIIALFCFSAFADKRAEVTILQTGFTQPVNTWFDNGDGKVEGYIFYFL